MLQNNNQCEQSFGLPDLNTTATESNEVFIYVRVAAALLTGLVLLVVILYWSRRKVQPIAKGLPNFTLFTALVVLMQTVVFAIATESRLWVPVTGCRAYAAAHVTLYNTCFVILLRIVKIRQIYDKVSGYFTSSAVQSEVWATEASSHVYFTLPRRKETLLGKVLASPIKIGITCAFVLVVHVLIVIAPFFLSSCPCEDGVYVYISFTVIVFYVMLTLSLTWNLKKVRDSLYLNKGNRNLLLLGGPGFLLIVIPMILDIAEFGSYALEDVGDVDPIGLLVGNVTLIIIPAFLSLFLLFPPYWLSFKWQRQLRDSNPNEDSEAADGAVQNQINQEYTVLCGQLPAHLTTDEDQIAQEQLQKWFSGSSKGVGEAMNRFSVANKGETLKQLSTSMAEIERQKAEDASHKNTEVQGEMLNDWFTQRRAMYNTVPRGLRKTPKWSYSTPAPIPALGKRKNGKTMNRQSVQSPRKAGCFGCNCCFSESGGCMCRHQKVDYEEYPFPMVLRNEIGMRKFKEFCVKELSYENPMFYETASKFVAKFEDPLLMTTEEVAAFEKRARKVHALYIEENAELWVNLPSDILSKFDKAGFKEGYAFNVFSFQEAILGALNNIYNLMKNDSYVRFKTSALYGEFIKLLQARRSILSFRKSFKRKTVKTSSNGGTKSSVTLDSL